MPSPKQYQVANLTSRFTTVNDKANSAFDIANSAYAQANAATSTGGGGYTQANNAYTQANAAYSQANTAYGQANTAYGQANAAYGQANSAYGAANTAQTTGQNAYGQANLAYSAANTAQTTAQDAYGQANTATTNAGNAYGQANLAYTQANNAYLAANNSNLKLGGVVSGTLNITQDIIVGGNIYLEGNTTFINVATYSVEDSLIYLASNNSLTDSVDIGFMGGKNTSGTYSHTGFARDATDGKWKLFDGLAEEGHVGNVVDFANTSLATLVANVEANTLSVINGVSGNVNFDSGTLFVDSVNDKVGIGTTTPISKLHVASTGVEGIIFNNASGDRISFTTPNRGTSPNVFGLGTGQHAIISVGEGIATNLAIGTFSTGSLILGTANTERARVTSSGDVGIGTASPSAKLHVVGNIRSDSGSFFGGLSTVGGRRNTVEINNYFKIGTWRNVAQADRLNLRIIGSASYSAGLTTCGETLIMLSFVNNNTAEGTFYSTGKHANITNVAVKTSADGSNYQVEVWVRIGNYGSTAVIPILAGGYWDAADVDTGSGSLPAGATALTSTAAFFTAGAERFTIDASGNVGIGSVSPGALLNLHAANPSILLNTTTDNGTTALVFNENGANAGRISVSGDYQSSVIEIENYSLGWANTGLVITNNNVGIGTNNPYSRLEVSGSTFNRITATATADVQTGIQIRRTGATAATDWELYSPQSSTDLRLYNGSDRVTFTNTGNVGIGTTNPGYLLQVTNSANTAKVYVSGPSVTTAGTPGASIYVRDTTATSGVVGRAGIHFSSSPGTDYTIGKYWDGTNSWFTIIDNSANQLLTISSGGNVGIGTTNPATKLHIEEASAPTIRINATTSGGGAGSLQFYNQGTQKFNLTTIANTNDFALYNNGGTNSYNLYIKHSDGNIGIATTSPGSRLTIHPLANSAVSTIEFTNGDNAVISAYYSLNFAVNNSNTQSGRTINFQAGGKGYGNQAKTMMVIEADSGNVGIGTTSPSGKLHLYDSGNSLLYIEGGAGYEAGIWFRENGVNKWEIYKRANPDDLNFYSSDLTESVMTLAAAGGVGIGTLSPSEKLHVQGNARVTGTLDISTSGMKDVIGTGGSGTYYSNTWYTIADKTSLPTEGMYVVIAFVDTYAVGGGFYYMKFGSVPFYWYPVTSNGPESYELPAMIGTGHAANSEPPPKIRVRQTYSNAGMFVEFQPGANWTGLNNVDGGKIVRFFIRRIA